MSPDKPAPPMLTEGPKDEQSTQRRPEPFEPPEVTLIGNVLVLLGGACGGHDDGH